MKTPSSALGLAVVAALCGGCGGGFAVGIDGLSDQSLLVGSFSRIAVHDGLNLRAALGERSVRVNGDGQHIRHVYAEVVDDVLVVGIDPSWVLVGSTPTVYVNNDVLVGAEATGGAKLHGTATAATEWPMVASGGSQIDITGLSATRLRIDASSGSRIVAAGTAGGVAADGSGGSRVDLYGVPAADITVRGSGGSVFSMRASQSASGSLSGASAATVFGNPVVQKIAVTGGSEVTFLRDLGAN